MRNEGGRDTEVAQVPGRTQPTGATKEETRRPPADTASIYRDFVAKGDRGGAVEYFMAKVVGMPAEFVAGARSQPWWAWTEGLAHTLAYDAEIMADYSLPAAKAAKVLSATLQSEQE